MQYLYQTLCEEIPTTTLQFVLLFVLWALQGRVYHITVPRRKEEHLPTNNCDTSQLKPIAPYLWHSAKSDL